MCLSRDLDAARRRVRADGRRSESGGPHVLRHADGATHAGDPSAQGQPDDHYGWAEHLCKPYRQSRHGDRRQRRRAGRYDRVASRPAYHAARGGGGPGGCSPGRWGSMVWCRRICCCKFRDFCRKGDLCCEKNWRFFSAVSQFSCPAARRRSRSRRRSNSGRRFCRQAAAHSPRI